MTSDQKYDGKADNANQIEQTGENANKTTSNAADGKQKLLDDLHKTAFNFCYASVDSQRTTFGLTMILQHWITTEYKARIREGACDEDMRLWETVIDNAFATINLVADLREQTDAIYYQEKGETEVELRAVYNVQSELAASYEEQISLLKQLAEAREETIKLLEERVSLLNEK